MSRPAEAAVSELPNGRSRTLKWGGLAIVAALLIAGVAMGINARNNRQASQTNAAGQFDTQEVSLDSLAAKNISTAISAKEVTINGTLQVNGGMILTPSLQSSTPQPGQIYYDQGNNVLGYYNGTEFVFLDGSSTGDVVEQIAGLTGQVALGAGLTVSSGELASSGVLSVQGQTGNVSFSGGNGITMNGTTIINSGVVSVVSSSPSLVVTNDGNGNLTLTPVGGGSGTVASSGGTAGRIAKFTAGQTIEDSLVSESGTTITVNGDLSVTGATNLGSPLTVANGGTGAATLAANGVLVGNGVGAISSIVAGGSGLCLTSTAGAPTWASCTNSGNAVTSVNGLSGALTIANATGLVNTITIDDASTTNKGIVQFNGTNFSVVSGNVNTAQNINTGASPTFSSLTLSGDVAVNGGDVTSTGALNITPGGVLTAGSASQALTLQGNASSVFTATNAGNTTTLSFQAPTANVNYRFPTAAVGSYDICTTAGNCGSGAGTVSTSGGTTGTLPVFTGATTIGDSLLSQSGATVTVNGNLNLALGNQYQINGVAISSAALSNDSNLAKLNASQTFTGNNVVFQNGSNSATAFAVQNAAGNRLATVDTIGGELELGQGSTIGGRIVFNNATNANTVTIVSAAVTGNRTITLPDDSGTICLDSGNCAGAGATLQTSYNNSTSPEIVLNGTNGALTLRDNSTPIAANLFEVQNNAGGTTYFAVTASGVSVTGTATATGNINSSGGTIQTNGTTRVDNAGNLANIGSLTLSGAISGGTTYSGSGNINTTGGVIQTNSTTRIDLSGNLTNIGALTLSGAISGGTTISGSGNINTTTGAIQTNSTTRIDNSGNLTNIAAITASGNAVLQGGTVTIGTSSQVGSLVLHDGNGGQTATISVGNIGANTALTIPGTLGVADTFCFVTLGNCAGSGSGVTTSGGSVNQLAKFTAGQNIENSTITDDGTTVTTSVDLVVQGGDATLGVATSQTGTLKFAHSGSANLGSIVQGALTGNRTYTLPDSTGTVCLDSGNCLGGGGGGANTALSNLTGVAINTTLLPGTAGTVHLGSGTLPFGDAFLAGSSGTPGTNNFRITGASTSGTRVITLPDATGTVCLQTSVSCGFAPTSGSANYIQNQIASPQTSASFSIDGEGRAPTFNATTGINTGAGAGTQRIDSSGNLVNIAAITASGNATLQGGVVTVGTTTQAGSIVLFDGSSNTGTLQLAALGQNTAYNLPDPGGVSADICLSTGNCLGPGGSGANTALSNLASVAINTTLLPGSAGSVNLGSGTLPFGDVFLAGTSVTPGTNNFKITGASTSGTRTITLPDASGTVCINTNNCNYAPTSGSANYIQNQIASPQTSANFSIDGEGRAATFNATTGLNTGAGAGTQRVDASGNLTNIGNLGLSGAISGGTTYSGSGNINTTAGSLQTNSTTRVDLSGNLTNIGNLTATGAITIASTGATNDIIINGADQFIVQDAAVFNTDADFVFADAENIDITNTVTGTNGVNLVNSVLTNNTTSGTQQVAVLQNAAGSGVTEALLLLDNADTDTAVTTGLQVTSAAGAITTALDVSDSDIVTALALGANDITGSVFGVTGASGNVTGGTYNGQTLSATASLTGTLTVANNLTLTSGDIAVNGGDITSTGALNITPTGALTAGATNQALTLQGNGSTTLTSTVSGNTTTVGFTSPTANTTLNFPALSAGTYNICTSSGNCLGAGATLQTSYNNSTNPEIVLDATRGALTVRDNATPIAANLLEVQNNTASTTYFAVTAGGVQTTGTNVSSGNINTTGGALQTNSLNRIDNSGNLVNIGNLTATGAITIASTGATNDIILNSADTIELQDATNVTGALSTSSTLTVGALGATDTATYLCRNGSNQLATCNTTGAGVAFLQGGNSFGATAVLGTNDNNGLQFEVNNTPVATFSNIGEVAFQNSTNSDQAFTVKETGGLAVLRVDTVSQLVAIGQSTGVIPAKLYVNTGSEIAARIRNFSSGDTNNLLEVQKVNNTVLSVASGGATTFTNSTNSTAALQVQNSVGVSGFNIDTTTTNVVTNPSFETNTTGWAAKGAATLSRITTQSYDNGASMQAATTAAVGDGATYAYSLAATTQYSLSMYVKTNSGGFNVFEIGYSNDGATDTSCSTNLFGETAKWARYTCTFTTGATSGSPYIYIKQINGAVRNIYIDAVSLEASGTVSQYRNAKVSVQGSFAVNVSQATASSSLSTLLVQSNGGGNGVVINGNSDGNVLESAFLVQTADGTSIFNVNEAAKGATIQGGSSFFNAAALLALSTNSGARALDVKGASGQSVDILNVKDSSNNVLLSVGSAGATTVKTMTNSTTGFQVQNSSATPLLTADTSNSRVYVGNTTGDTTGSLLVADTKTDIGDPTGVNGAMYYNAAYGRFRCYQNSVWVDCIGGGSREYLRAHMQTNQTANMASNDHVKFDTVNASAGGSVTLDTTTTYTSAAGASVGRFTLAAGKTYRLSGSLQYAAWSNCCSVNATFRWYDVTNSNQFGSAGVIIPGTYDQTNGQNPNAEAIITPASTIIVEMRLTGVAGTLSQIGDSGSFVYPNAYIEVLSDGGAGGASAAEYLRTQLGTDQSTDLVDGDHIKFDSVDASSGSSISLDTTTAYTNGGGASVGRFTLAAGKTYKLHASIPRVVFGSANSSMQYVWHNVTAGTWPGAAGASVSATWNSSNIANDPYAEAVITTSVSTLMELEITGVNGTISLIGGGGGGDLRMPSVFIEVLSDGTKIAQFEGATISLNGEAGYVPQPVAGQQGSVLLGDGTWSAGVTFLNGAATFQNAADSTSAFRILDAAGTTALLTADTTTDTIRIGWKLSVIDNIINGGNDFIVGNTDQVTRGNCNNCRALVKNVSNVLTINYAGDFTGGVQVQSPLDARYTADSTTAFTITGSGSVTRLVVDTTNSRVYIGSPTADGTGAILVLDTKNTSGDPATTINGAMYYNSNAGKLRCYQGEWRDCVSSVSSNGIGGGSAFPSGTTTSTTYVNVPGGASALSFTKKAANTKLTFQLNMSFYVTVASKASFLAINLDGTDYECMVFWWNVTSQHLNLSCNRVITGISAGAKTAQVRWKVDAGGSMTGDSGDRLSLTVLESD